MLHLVWRFFWCWWGVGSEGCEGEGVIVLELLNMFRFGFVELRGLSGLRVVEYEM